MHFSAKERGKAFRAEIDRVARGGVYHQLKPVSDVYIREVNVYDNPPQIMIKNYKIL